MDLRFYTPEPTSLKVGEIGNTVRDGLKWADLKAGDTLDMKATFNPKDSGFEFGKAEVMSVVVKNFHELTPEEVQLNHKRNTRILSQLLKNMVEVYPGFKADNTVTVLTFKRVA